MGRLFTEVLAQAGLDGASIFATLRAGSSLADALSLSPALVDLLHARACGWAYIGRYDKAETLFRALCILDDRNANYRVDYGIALKMSGRLDAAATAFHRARALRPDWAVPNFHLLDLALRQSHWRDAAKALRAFDETATPELTPEIMAEANRCRRALALREEGAAAEQQEAGPA